MPDQRPVQQIGRVVDGAAGEERKGAGGEVVGRRRRGRRARPHDAHGRVGGEAGNDGVAEVRHAVGGVRGGSRWDYPLRANVDASS